MVVAQSEGTVLYARYSGKKDASGKVINGNWGNAVGVAYGTPTQKHSSFGFYGHFGLKQIEEKANPGDMIDGADVEGGGITVREGDTVKPGRILGIVGNTGKVFSSDANGGGTHLHYQHVTVTQEKLDRLKTKVLPELKAMSKRGNGKSIYNNSGYTVNDLINAMVGKGKETKEKL